MRQPMIGQSSSHRMKVIMPLLERVQKSGKGRDVSIAGFFQPRHPGIELLRRIHLQGLVRPKRRINPQARRTPAAAFTVL